MKPHKPKQPAKGSKGPPRALKALAASDAISAALAFRGITDDIRARRLMVEWSELVGARVASRTRPAGVFDRVLVVEVASSAWLHELTLLKVQLFNGLQDRIGQPPIFDELRFKLATGRRAEGLDPPRARPRTALPPQPSGPATGAAREQILREAETVDDLELRELIARVRISRGT